MKVHLAWIRKTAAAALVVGVGVQTAAAQYAPFRPIPQQPAAPKQAPVAAAPTTPYVAYRTQPAYQPVPPAYQPAPVYQAQPTARYQAPVTPVPPAAPAVAYRQPVAAYPQYPQTAIAQYPTAYGTQPYYVANQPTEAIPAPAQPATSAPVMESMPGQAMPAEGMAPMAQGAPAPAGSGYAAAGCNCGAAGGYTAGQYYGAGGSGCQTGYPDCSGYIDDCGPENIWFGGVYFLYMDRYNDSKVRLTVEVPVGAVYPYHPPESVTVVNTSQVATDFRPGVEFRFGSTFTCGDSCQQPCGSGYGYNACGCNSCAPAPSCSRMYAWEAAWWGIDDDEQSYMFEDTIPGAAPRIYGMKNFSGLEYDRDGAGGAYAYRPVNDYYNYGLPIPAPPGAPAVGDTIVLAQRVRNNFNAQNLELNVMRFPLMDTCGCGGGSCGYDACGCNSGCDSCGCEECYSGFTSYGSCGVRYFRTDDDFGYDTETAVFVGPGYDQAGYDGFSYTSGNELFWNIDIENNLIGPQMGWTSNYCYGCKWNFFLNSTFGVFNNHINQYQRVFSGGGGVVRYAGGANQTMEIRNSKDALAFLGELRAGGSYDLTCHCRLVAAYRALALTGVATSAGQFTNDFSSYETNAYIDSNQSMIVHGLQTGVECRY
jgi:hypothetical protein